MPPLLHAAPDGLQKYLIQKVINAKRELAQAQAVQGACRARARLLQEYMRMLNDSMSQMQATRPRAGMTMKEQEEGIAEHQKLMDEMMRQMMDSHRALTQMDC